MTVPLSTDLYQLTMAQAYLHAGKGSDRAVFHLFFRRLPFAGGYALGGTFEWALAGPFAFETGLRYSLDTEQREASMVSAYSRFESIARTRFHRAGLPVRLRLASHPHVRYLLIWFTRLPPNGAGTYQVFISSVMVTAYAK